MTAWATAVLSVVLGSALAMGVGAREKAQAPEAQQTPGGQRAVPVQRVGGEIKEPTKLKNVPPVYPDAAKQARVQGIVVLECTISPRGNVVDVKVLRGIPLLDQAAVDAVKQWIYTPTLLNNVPVPVIMTVTVTFKLSDGPVSLEAAPATVTPTPTPEPTGPPEKLADIRRLLELNGSRATSQAFLDAVIWQLRSQAKPETPPEFWRALGEELRAERLEDMAVPIYDKHFTHEEIRDFIRFYETPAGRKLGASMLELTKESLAAASSRAPALAQKFIERLRTSGYLKDVQHP